MAREWDAASGKNIRWKTAVPLPGNNSPVVWNGRVFLTGADEGHRAIYGFDADSGKLLWQTEIPETPESAGKIPKPTKDTGFAAPTAVVNDHGVYAMFANGDLAACDRDGKLLWTRGFGIPENIYGHGASLAIDGDHIILQLDQSEAKKGLSRLYAISTADGSTVWETPRARCPTRGRRRSSCSTTAASKSSPPPCRG